MKVDFGVHGHLADVPDRARALEAAGVDGVFTFEASSDVFLPLALVAEHTNLFCYSNVALALPRSPMHLAYLGHDLQRLSEGRTALGLGSQIRPHIEKRFSARWDRPVGQMREVIESIRAIHHCWKSGEQLDYRGEHYTFTLMTPMFVPQPHAWDPPPIWLGALGPQMTRLAGEVADGILVHPFHTRRFLEEVTIPRLEDGIEAVGRSRDDVVVIPTVLTCAYRNEEERERALRGVRMNLAFYGSTPAYRATLEMHGWGEIQAELNRLTKEGRWDEIPVCIDDEVLHTIAVVGTPAEIGREMAVRYRDVAARVGLSMPYQHGDDLLAEVVSEIRVASS